MKHDFLPEGHESLRTEKKYWKPSQFKEGDNKLRIVQRPVAGWIDWKDKKPFRYRPNERPKQSFDSEKPMKAFWICHVWDYAREDLFILEITQGSILKSLTSYGSDEDWGDFTTYDIKIRKEGSGLETEYNVTPLPHKPLNEKIVQAIKAIPVRLEALYEGKDPWVDLEPSVNKETGEVIISAQEKISEAEAKNIVSLIEELKDPELTGKILKTYKVSKIEDLHATYVPSITTHLENKKTQKSKVA